MSLNPLQMHNTKKELRKNFELTRLSKSEVATDLKISEVKLEKIFNLNMLFKPLCLCYGKRKTLYRI